MVLVVLTFHQMVQNYGQVRTACACTKNKICYNFSGLHEGGAVCSDHL